MPKALKPAGSSSEQLCAVLGIERPVLLAPMANVSGGALAAAVSRAGGFGVIGGGYGNLEWIEEQLIIAGDARVGIGLITWHLADGALDGVLAHRPTAVWLSFGDPGPHIDAIHSAGAVSICQVGTLEGAIEASNAGADVIVAQGTEAGGHGRQGKTLAELLPAISTGIPEIPLVAAGGINDNAGLDAAHALGAAGVALGTAFYATPEALDDDEAKTRLVEASGDDTIHSTVYDIIRGPEWSEEYSGRSIRSRLTDEWTGREDDLRLGIEVVRRQYDVAVRNRDMSMRVVWAGVGLDAITDVRPAAEITKRFRAVRRA